MALVLKDRVKETTAVVGTGTATLLGAAVGYQSFNTAIPTGSVVYYCIAGQGTSEWEVGYGTFTAPDQLSRDSIYESSAAGAAVSFSAGTKDIFVTYPAEQAVFQETNGDLRIIDGVIEVSLDGTSSANLLPNVSFQAFSTIDSYMQANQQNFSSGNSASADYVVTADNGTDSENFIDLGMASSGYNYPEFSATKANDGYVISTGNNLVIVSGKYGANSSNLSNATDIVFVAGSLLDTEERMRVKSATGNVILSNAANPTDNGQKLQVVGDADISANVTVGGTIVIEGAAYSNAANITALNQLATKAYVDTATATGIHVHDPVRLEQGSNLVAIYNQPNGAGNGIGATLTNNATQETFVVDGITTAVNDRILVYGQTNGYENGVYTVTATGNATTNWVLTRATDADTYSTQDSDALGGGDYFYVTSGNTGAGESYICTNEGTITFGTTAITFSQFSASPAYTGTAPINVSGQTIALTGVVDVAHGGTNVASYTAGDIIYASASTTLNKLALGSSGQALIVSGSSPAWGAIDLSSNAVSATLPPQHGGTGISSYTQGDMLYANSATSIDKVAGNTTTTKKFLGQTGTGTAAQAPVWEQPAASDITGLAPSATTDTSNASNITSGTLPTGRLVGDYGSITGVGTLANGVWAANTIAIAYGGTGAANASDARTNLGLTIGANVQAYSVQLQSLADVASNGMLARSASNTITPRTITAGDTISVSDGDGSAGNPTISFGVAPGASGNVLTSNGTAWTSSTPTAGGGGFTSVSAISTNTNAVKSTLYVLTASLTLTLPASPTAGDMVGVSNLSNTLTCVIGRNGQKIMNLSEDMTLDVEEAGFTLVYTGATYGWVII